MPMSGKDMLKLFLKSGWKILRQKGDHVQVGKDSYNQTIPLQKELKKGTEHALLKSLKEAK